VYKQKLKHVLSEHHGAVSGRKADGVAVTTLAQDRHARSELGLRGELRGLRADLGGKELCSQSGAVQLTLVRPAPRSVHLSCCLEFVSTCCHFTTKLSPC